jgi:hypothetical protein
MDVAFGAQRGSPDNMGVQGEVPQIGHNCCPGIQGNNLTCQGFDEVKRLGLGGDIEKEVRSSPAVSHGIAPPGEVEEMLLLLTHMWAGYWFGTATIKP